MKKCAILISLIVISMTAYSNQITEIIRDLSVQINEAKKKTGQLKLPIKSLPSSIEYCKPLPPGNGIPTIPTVDDPAIKKQIDPKIVKIIENYRPVFYLHEKEHYFPILIEEYLLGPNTGISYLLGTQNSSVIPFGQVTMEKIYGIYKDSLKPNFKYDAGRIYPDIKECVRFGSNPALHGYKTKTDTLTIPVYARIWEDATAPNSLFIHYAATYGFNAPFTIRAPFILHSPIGKSPTFKSIVQSLGFLLGIGSYQDGYPLLVGDVLPVQNAHEFDFEHVTMEVDKKSLALKRIYFSSHGRNEGFWMNANHPDLTYEGTHPVVYVAYGSHGMYPKAGTFVRVWGLANDITSKGIRWAPKIRIFYDNKDTRFDPKTMSWVYWPGSAGKRGVKMYFKQDWATNIAADEGRANFHRDDTNMQYTGKKFDEVALFCPTSETDPRKATQEAQDCIGAMFMKAKPPK